MILPHSPTARLQIRVRNTVRVVCAVIVLALLIESWREASAAVPNPLTITGLQDMSPWVATDCEGNLANLSTLAGEYCVEFTVLDGSRLVLGVNPPPRELGFVAGIASGKRPVYAAAAGARGKKLGDLPVGPATQPATPVSRMRCNPRETIKSGSTIYARVTDDRAPLALRAGFVGGCVSFGLQTIP